MLEFKKADINDLEVIKEYYVRFKEFSCENTAVNILTWQNKFGFEFCVFEDMLFTKVKYGKNYVFCLPAAKNMKRAVELLKEYCESLKISLDFIGAEGERLDLFKENFEEAFTFVETRDSFEYIYSSEQLANLSGKKLHSKRNHISSFKKKYNWSYEELKPENLNQALLMTEQWYNLNSEKSDKFMQIERDSVKLIFDNFENIDIKGGILKVDEKIVAVTFGSEINSEVFDVSYEKALTGYDGAYTMINNCFAAQTLKDYSLINREDDMGLEGLRKAKLSYKPQILLKKYLIREK